MSILPRSVLCILVLCGMVFFSGCSGTTPKVGDKAMPPPKSQLGQFQTKEELFAYLEKDPRFIEWKTIDLTSAMTNQQLDLKKFEQVDKFISKYDLADRSPAFKDYQTTYKSLQRDSKSNSNSKGMQSYVKRTLPQVERDLHFAIHRDLIQFDENGIMSRQEFSERAERSGFHFVSDSSSRPDGRIEVRFANYEASGDSKTDRINRKKVAEPASLSAEIFNGKVICIDTVVASQSSDNRKEIFALTDKQMANTAMAEQIQQTFQPKYRYSWVRQLMNALFVKDPQIAKDVETVLDQYSQYQTKFIQDRYREKQKEELSDQLKTSDGVWFWNPPSYEIKSGLKVSAAAIFSLSEMRPVVHLRITDPYYDLLNKHNEWIWKSMPTGDKEVPIKINSASRNNQEKVNVETTKKSNAIVATNASDAQAQMPAVRLTDDDQKLAGLTLSSTLSDAEQIFGKPISVELFKPMNIHGGTNIQFKRYSFDGAEVVGANGLEEIKIYNGKYSTYRGVRPGQSEKDMFNAYGRTNPGREFLDKKTNRNCISYTYRWKGCTELNFVIDSETRKIISISIHAWTC